MVVKCIIRTIGKPGLYYSWWYDVKNVTVKEIDINGHKYFRFFVVVANHVSGDIVGEFEAHNFYTVKDEQPLDEVLKERMIG